MAKKSGQPVEVRRAVFLALLPHVGTVSEACRLAKLSRETIARWKRDDPEFATALKEAQDLAFDALEDSMYRRARFGVPVPIFVKGEKVGERREYDTPAGIFLMKGARPERYRDRVSAEFTGPTYGELIEASMAREASIAHVPPLVHPTPPMLPRLEAKQIADALGLADQPNDAQENP